MAINHKKKAMNWNEMTSIDHLYLHFIVCFHFMVSDVSKIRMRPHSLRGTNKLIQQIVPRLGILLRVTFYFVFPSVGGKH